MELDTNALPKLSHSGNSDSMRLKVVKESDFSFFF